MKYERFLLPMIMVVAIYAVVGQIAGASGYEIPLRHSEQDEDLRSCSNCHEDDGEFPYRRFEHSLFFAEKHRVAAAGSQRVCEMCHRPSYCSDCHDAGVELKPSIKNHSDPRRFAPHRGDYMTRHRIDGHLNPAKCFSCHGSPRTATSCRRCHG